MEKKKKDPVGYFQSGVQTMLLWHCLLTSMYVCLYVCVSADHPYSQPEGWITKGAAQRDRPNAYERHLWLPPNGHEWSRTTAAKQDVFDLGKGQTTTPKQVCQGLRVEASSKQLLTLLYGSLFLFSL